ERHDRYEQIVSADHTLSTIGFLGYIIAEQATVPAGAVRTQRLALARRLIRNVFGGPDLAVRVRIAGAHHLAAVLEYLHVTHPVVRGQPLPFNRPGVDHLPDRRGIEAGQREI